MRPCGTRPARSRRAGPTTAASHAGPIGKANAYFYKKLQYRGSVNYAKRNKQQPLPQSRNILSQHGVGNTVEHRETI